MSNVTVVTGGQYGSEAKGHITAQLVREALVNGWDAYNIRVAGPNAGHTVYDAEGNKFAFRQVPVGAVVRNGIEAPAFAELGEVFSIIAAGSEIDVPVLLDELRLMTGHGHGVRLFVDYNATLIRDKHKVNEEARGLTARLGSTAKGIGAARADRIWRVADRLCDDFDAVVELTEAGAVVCDTSKIINEALNVKRAHLIIEGTQGYGLGLHTEAYPKTTSSDCRAIDFLAMAGVSPWHSGVAGMAVMAVCRVFPIRVAGNSGPIKGETSWDDLGLEAERTTVTQKVRRVGAWDSELVAKAVRANGGGGEVRNPYAQMLPEPVTLAVTMVDQLFAEAKDCTAWLQIPAETRDRIRTFLDEVEAETGAPVGMITTSPTTAIWLS